MGNTFGSHAGPGSYRGEATESTHVVRDTMTTEPKRAAGRYNSFRQNLVLLFRTHPRSCYPNFIAFRLHITSVRRTVQGYTVLLWDTVCIQHIEKNSIRSL